MEFCFAVQAESAHVSQSPDTNWLSRESQLLWQRRSRCPQVFEKSGFTCFSKTLASCIHTRLHASWYEMRGRKF
jgi:hypothetical protein